ncbi:hypothetical protein AVEN_210359-1 [Araneus ventricosus]|uniref:Uncharacterized protein n=1 Tax=Araneus ventricosus TaxID=182803 RepID=A0A4Y2CVH4_ARAVE|nr:hypothetical protein AVEN_210359-1 [Araneus ventricosus]
MSILLEGVTQGSPSINGKFVVYTVDEDVDKPPYPGPSTNGKFVVYTVDENVDKPPYPGSRTNGKLKVLAIMF